MISKLKQKIARQIKNNIFKLGKMPTISSYSPIKKATEPNTIIIMVKSDKFMLIEIDKIVAVYMAIPPNFAT